MREFVLRRGRARWSCLAALVASASALAALLVVPLEARASSAWQVVRYHGYRLTVPAHWPVFNLAAHPTVCVRFNRHAVYLGRPSTDQSCPSQALGRTEAILVQPIARVRWVGDAVRALPAPSLAGADAQHGTEAQVLDRSRGVLVTATWNHRPEVIAQALGVRSAQPLAAASRVRPGAASGRVLAHGTVVAQMASAAEPGQVYTGEGFDACTTPSSSQMSAWSSAYRAIGVYIGGVNMGCSQPNLTSNWVQEESAAGWHLIPIYVGLQAPGNSCGCAALSSGSAASQGQAAAEDAVSQARAIGLGQGNPIYYDMEGYARGGTTSAVVLAFLGAWTQQLHAEGYKSGVYSSDDSGIVDLVSNYGSGYSEPDDIWPAAWNGQAGTSDANIPSGEWASHQRVHQYAGNETQTHGGVTINIDSDYVDAATAATGSSAPTTLPVNTAVPSISGSAIQGETLTEEHGAWSGNPSSYSYAWEDCGASGNNCSEISGATARTYTLHSSDYGHTIRVLETAANSAGSGSPATSAPTGVVKRQPTYWVYTSWGNVYGSYGAIFYGSPWASQTGDSQITGMAPTPDGKGYWMVDSYGHVYPYGDAQSLAQYVSSNHPAIAGIVASPSGGYWLYTASGNVYTSAGATWYGSPWASHTGDDHITGMTSTPDGKGYWMVDSSGHVYHYGDAQSLAEYLSSNHPWISGIVASPSGGYWLFAASGNVYTSADASWYGSPWASHTGDSHIEGLAAAPDGHGYWMVDSSGRVYHYGDAPGLTTGLSSNAPPVAGIVP
jgi:hypothetical protein